LETIIREEIGSERAYTKPLRQTISLLKKHEDERTQILQKQGEVFSLFRELRQCENNLTKHEAQKNQILYKQLLADYEEIKLKNESINKCDLRIADLAKVVEIWKTLSDFPIGIRDNILRLSANRTRLQNECQNSENSATEASVKLQTIERAIDSQRMMVKEYEDAKVVSLDEFSNIQNLKKKLDIAEHNVKTCQSRLNIALEVLNNYKEKIDVNSALLDQGLTIANLVEFEQKLIALSKGDDQKL